MKSFLKKLGVIGVLGLFVFTPAVIALLVYLHSRTPVVEPVLPPTVASDARKVWVCDGAPPWALEHLPRVVEFWGKVGCPIEAAGAGPCPETCTFDVDGAEVQVPCKQGHIAVVLRDAWADPTHAGDTLLSISKDPVVRLPQQIETVDPTSPGGLAAAPQGKDLPALLLAHEVGHALNLGHSQTPIGDLAVAHKSGEVMNPTVTDLGWGAAGISCD